MGLKFAKELHFEDGYDKIALYSLRNGTITHAARWWLEDKGWSSKLGESNDILHHSLECCDFASRMHMCVMPRIALHRRFITLVSCAHSLGILASESMLRLRLRRALPPLRSV